MQIHNNTDDKHEEGLMGTFTNDDKWEWWDEFGQRGWWTGVGLGLD